MESVEEVIEFRFQFSETEWTNWQPIPADATYEDYTTVQNNPDFFKYQYRYNNKVYPGLDAELMEIIEKRIAWHELTKSSSID